MEQKNTRRRRSPAGRRARRRMPGVAGWLMLAGGFASACAPLTAGPPGQRVAGSGSGRKLAPDVRERASRDKFGRMSVLIRTTGPLSAGERQALREAGVTIGPISGDIVAATLRPEALGRLTALRFVRYVELAKALPPPGGTP